MTEQQEEFDETTVAPKTPASLAAAAQAECQALRNDVQQAREMAGEFQRQLAGKSNDFAELKRLYETTVEAVAQLQARVTELRQERHGLANKVMHLVGLERKLTQVTEERQRLQNELATMRGGLSSGPQETVRPSQGRDARIARLTAEVASLKNRLEQTPAGGSGPAAVRRVDAEVKAAIAEVATSLQRLWVLIEPGVPESKSSHPEPAKTETETFIDISFAK
jgi:chromosome segregation ATPase